MCLYALSVKYHIFRVSLIDTTAVSFTLLSGPCLILSLRLCSLTSRFCHSFDNNGIVQKICQRQCSPNRTLELNLRLNSIGFCNLLLRLRLGYHCPSQLQGFASFKNSDVAGSIANTMAKTTVITCCHSSSQTCNQYLNFKHTSLSHSGRTSDSYFVGQLVILHFLMDVFDLCV